MAIFRLVSLIAALLASSLLHAADEAGRVLFARGVVSALDEADSRRGLRNGDPVYEGERIITGRSAVVQIHLSDGALLGLRGNSEYLIERQQYEPESDLAEQAGELFSGWMRMITGAIGKSRPNNVRVSTSVATIGIRGTVFQLLHVPETGLEGFNDVEPGSYVMLEDGGIDFFNDGGVRRVDAGGVAFAGALGQAPTPRPDHRHLFARHLESLSVTRDDLRRLRLQYFLREQSNDVDGSLQTVLDKEILSTTFVNLGALTSYSPGGRNVRLVAGGDNVLYTSNDTTRLLTGLRGDPGDASIDFLQANGSGGPLSTGQALIGGLSSQVHWGIWREGTFDASNSSTGPYAVTGDWHYMMASNIQVDPAVLASSLTGSFSYSYVGGTLLSDSTGAADFANAASIGQVQSGQLNVDFGSALMQANLSLSLPNQGLTVGMSGGGSLTQFYDSGLTLSDGGAVTGNLQGAFIGPTAEGAISAIEINDADNNANYQGMAVFERTGPGVALP